MIPDHPPYLDQNPRHRVDIRDTVRVLAGELALHNKSSILDLGCNTGDWLRGFIECGYELVLGIDQASMLPHLLIRQRNFLAADLRELSRNHPCNVADLVLCMEVGEHMEERDASVLVRACIDLAAPGGVIVFSAATPGQGGHGHINEQPHSYWAAKFREQGWTWDESIRERLPEALVWWYRRNMAICRRRV